MRIYLGNRGQGARVAEEQIGLLDRQRMRLLEEAHFMHLRQRYVDVKIEYWRAVQTGDNQQIGTMKTLADSIASELKLPKQSK